MEEIQSHEEFLSLMKYAVAIRMTPPVAKNGVPTIGIVYANSEIPSRCHTYLNGSYEGNALKIHIKPGYITASVELKEVVSGQNIFRININYDQVELLQFQQATDPDGRVALIFGFRRGCDYYVTGNEYDAATEFSPMVVGYAIDT